MSVYQIIGIILIGLVAGILSSIVGIGGGIVIVPALVIGYGLSQHNAQGTSLALLSIPVTLIAAYNYHKQGMVNWQIAIILAIGFVVGGYFGSKIALGLSPQIIKRVFACIMILIAIKLFWDTRKV
jgi:uncharacterized protein